MASALIRAVRRVSPVRAARPSRSTGPSPRASNTPSSLAANRCLLAMKPCAISKMRSGVTTSWTVRAAAVPCGRHALSLRSGGPRPLSQILGVPRRIRTAVRSKVWPETLVPRVRDDIQHRVRARGLTLGGLRRRRRRRARCRSSRSTPTAATRSIPGTILFTGSVNRNVGCSGSWLAHHEYVVEDVNKWSFLAHSGRIAGATSIDTHGDLSRSTRHRPTRRTVSATSCGSPSSSTASTGARRPSCATPTSPGSPRPRSRRWSRWPRRSRPACAAPSWRSRSRPYADGPVDHGPGVVVFDEHGEPESISGAAAALDRRTDRGPAAGHAERVEDRAGDRGSRPRHPARTPTRSSWPPEPGSATRSGDLAPALRHPARRRTPADGPR